MHEHTTTQAAYQFRLLPPMSMLWACGHSSKAWHNQTVMTLTTSHARQSIRGIALQLETNNKTTRSANEFVLLLFFFILGLYLFCFIKVDTLDSQGFLTQQHF